MRISIGAECCVNKCIRDDYWIDFKFEKTHKIHNTHKHDLKFLDHNFNF